MTFSSLVNGPSKGNEGSYVLPSVPNHASFHTHNPTLRLRPYHLRGYPGHQTQAQPASDSFHVRNTTFPSDSAHIGQG
jgi:hypothetical protein